MEKIKLLDCTLRDGGYVNDWSFKRQNIRKIISSLAEAKIDIIECGFLSNKNEYNEERSVFDTIDRTADFLPEDRGKTKYVCMINYGEYEAKDIPQCTGKSVDGIRVAFHKGDLEGAVSLCNEISKKGYLVFMQPMVTNNYSDIELLNLIEKVNQMEVYAFYIVDSFGVMKQSDLLRRFYIIDNNLREDIIIGYHAHNNLQMAYSNAQSFISTRSKRSRIVDSSVFGMGRGAGNLNSELFAEYLNENHGKSYKIYPLLDIIDSILNKIYIDHYWGYSLPHFLSATFNCHPNYATYLSEKNALTVKSISDILNQISDDKKTSFDKQYIEELYINYQKHYINDEAVILKLKEEFKNRSVLIMAPGSSLYKYAHEIKDVVQKEKTIVVSINFIPEGISPDYIFVSNEKRYEKLRESEGIKGIRGKLILTSNLLNSDNEEVVVNYNNLLNDIEAVKDNSTLMLLKLLSKLEVNRIFVAGLDGYEEYAFANYVNEDMVYTTSRQAIKELNEGMKKALKELVCKLNIFFITPTKYL